MNPKRVVSLSPAITEIVYALGRENRLIGVTRFCRFPPEAKQKPQVGGYYDVNRELITKLHPDVVLLPVGENEVRGSLEAVGLRTCSLDLRSVDAVYETIFRIGRLLDAGAEATTLVESLKTRMRTLSRGAEAIPRKSRVLLIVGRNYDATHPEDVFITGNDGFCNALLSVVGAENAYTGRTPFPKVSVEGILAMNPDVLIESVPTALRQEIPDAEITRAWQTVNVNAVRNGRIYLMDDDPPLIPGVSMVAWAEKLQRILLEK